MAYVRATTGSCNWFTGGTHCQLIYGGGGQVGSRTGEAMVAMGEVSGDGFQDWAVSAPFWSGVGFVSVKTGALLIPDSHNGIASLTYTGLVGASPGSALGRGLAAGDLDGDGDADLVAGAPGQGGGVAHVLLTSHSGGLPGGTYDTADHLDASVAGGPGELAGSMVATADVDGDGREDLLVLAPGSRSLYVFRSDL